MLSYGEPENEMEYSSMKKLTQTSKRRDTLDIALWRKKSACLSSKDAFLRKNILKNPSRERASFDSLLASFGVSLNAKRCALNRKLNRNSCR